MVTPGGGQKVLPSKRIANDLRGQILDGILGPGQKLPSERMLAQQYGTARNTAREAIRLLSEQGLVIAEHGRGVFVSMDSNRISTRSTLLHSVSVAGAVVRDDGRMLVVQRADNKAWEPPGGVLEIHEAPEAGVRREAYEETGITVEVQQLTGVYKNTSAGVLALVFRCKPSGGSERTSSESIAVGWLTPEEVSERMSEVFAIRLLDALDGNGPHVRSHDGKRLILAR